MRVFTIVLILFSGSLTRLTAGESLGKCFDADTNKFVTIAEAAPTTDYLLTARMPAVQWKDDKPVDLKWIDCPSDVSAQREQIGSYRNRAVYRTIYRKRVVGDESPSAFVCIVFTYQTFDWVSQTRPFFIWSNDDGLWGNVESHFTSQRGEPFALEIGSTMSGTGVFTSGYTFGFTSREVRILQRSESGRHMRTKTYFYDKAGKVIKSENAEKE